MKTPDFSSLFQDMDALIIIPPFFALDIPSLAVHTLQAFARAAGFRVSVLYANLILAAELGDHVYTFFSSFAGNSMQDLWGERLFARAAYGTRSFDSFHSQLEEGTIKERYNDRDPAAFGIVGEFEKRSEDWFAELAEAVLALNPAVVGCSTTFEQTAASIAILKRIKNLAPGIITILGGANCEGEMAQGLLSVGDRIDYIFSGKSEISFTDFLQDFKRGILPPLPVIKQDCAIDLSEACVPCYEEYYQQLAYFLPERMHNRKADIYLPYETSRGCWWGEKKQCTFCGLNGGTLQYKEKEPQKVIEDLKQLLQTHPSRKILMLDNIMPRSYHKTLVPRLPAELPGIDLFYELKANMTLNQFYALKQAGMERCQAGIEALDSGLLKRMHKGVLSRQNLVLLKHAVSLNLYIHWNLLVQFPGDTSAEYETTYRLLPLLTHLHPPHYSPVSIQRFSHFFKHPADYHLSNIRPLPVYAQLLPSSAKVEQIAYFFEADYPSFSGTEAEFMHRFYLRIKHWQELWQASSPPKLELARISPSEYLLLDTRGLPGLPGVQYLEEKEARAIVCDRPLAEEGSGGPTLPQAVDRQLGVVVDSWYISLVACDPEIYMDWMQQA